MHRPGYKGRKLSLERDQRQALLRGLVTSLVLYESIRTTEAKAKEAAPLFERLVTKAKLGTLAGERAIRKVLLTEDAVQKLIHELKPGFAERQGGYTRVIKAGYRRGDNAPLAVIGLVLPDKPAENTPKTEHEARETAPDTTKATTTKKAVKKKAAAAAGDTK